MRYLVGFILSVLSMSLYAVQVEGLYTATVAVDSQSQLARNVAVGVAIKKVVQKVSGRRSVMENQPLQAALSNVSSYVEQFQYKKMEEDLPGYWLTVSFQKTALDKVMKQFGVPVWGGNRPDVLLWLAVEDEGEKYIVNAESKELAELIKGVGADTGLAITLPLLDLVDQRSISFNDVWAGFSDHVLVASSRYGAKQVMFARLLKDSGSGWRLSWTLMDANTQHTGLERNQTLVAVITATFSELAENLANVYAPYGGVTESMLSLKVSGVQDLAKFVQVTKYLSSLDMVKKLNWNEMRDNSVTLEINVSGDVAVLKDIIALNDVLQPDVAPIVVSTGVVNNTQEPMQPPRQTLYYKAN
jgi:hypothetical protein